MYAALETAAWRRRGCLLLCANRSVDLLRVSSALCTGTRACRAFCQG
ncbi:hypothetical protein [Streptomyces auratus]|uniref:Uncharacterized protein n=1 Tax=Streptomyces auratus AGR0001 TaxID=1160718 RepID=A0A8B1NRZ5_9ACTN|nr:hypothetical protein [Streptomyces auratus]QTZ90622.1 hypothetical protein SU9_003385 [Streptomyces auratus AGR0001]